MAKTKQAGIPQVPAKVPKELRPFLSAVRENLQVQIGQRGKQLDKAVTFRDLQEGNIAGLNVTQSGVSLVPPRESGGGDIYPTPDYPVNVQAAAGFDFVLLSWDMPIYNGHKHAEIYRNLTDEVGTATLVGTSSGMMFSDTVDVDSAYYYWVRFINHDNDLGPWHSTNGLYVETRESYQSAIGDAKQDITDALDFWKTTIDQSVLNIDTSSSESALGLNILIEDTRDDFVAKLETYKAQTFDENGNFNTAFMSKLNGAITNPDGSIFVGIKNNMSVSSTDLDGNTVTMGMEDIAALGRTVEGDLHAQWGVKLTVDDLQYGVGLVKPPGETEVSFLVSANNFGFHDPTLTEDVYPFLIDNGKVLIDTALIDTATITTLIAGDLIAENIKVGTDITTPAISGGTISGTTLDLSSGSYSIKQTPDNAMPFWFGLTTDTVSETTAKFGFKNDGTVIARGITIYDDNDNVILASGTGLNISTSDVTGLGALALVDNITSSSVTDLGLLATKNTVSATTDITGLGALATKDTVSATTDISGLGGLAYLNAITTTEVTDLNFTFIDGLLTNQIISAGIYAENIDGDVTDHKSYSWIPNAPGLNTQHIQITVAPAAFDRTLVINPFVFQSNAYSVGSHYVTIYDIDVLNAWTPGPVPPAYLARSTAGHLDGSASYYRYMSAPLYITVPANTGKTYVVTAAGTGTTSNHTLTLVSIFKEGGSLS